MVYYTACFMKAVPSVYTLLMHVIYLSLSKQEAEGTVFRKYTVCIFLSKFCMKNLAIHNRF